MKHSLIPRVKAILLLGILSAARLAQGAIEGPAFQAKAGDLNVRFQNYGSGIKVESVADQKLGEELQAGDALPLFQITLRQAGSTNQAVLTADAGWQDSTIRPGRRQAELRWRNPTNAPLTGLSVMATLRLDQRSSALHWKFKVENASTNWSVWQVTFPQIALGDLGTNAVVLFPRGPGEVQAGVWQRPFHYHGNYPDGWCSMQLLAAYRSGAKPTGLYLAAQDPWGSTKSLVAKSEPTARALQLAFEHPAPDMGVPGNDFTLEGEAVWQLFRGDWFDAAMIYREWARREAKWRPRLGREGRTDTPLWMRQLNAWAMTGGGPSDCVAAVKQMRESLGLPLGFHWYNWHQIPFDNDYPHYFPAKDGFAAGVNELKSAGVFPMPYINGRLWDAHDRGAEDYEFTRRALPAATKQGDGRPHLETYGSKETNGEPVSLAAMCPTTPLWRNTVSNIVWRLLQDCGTSGVYIDQVAAAAPKLCLDRSHGHPLGGGHWWNEGYWKMLEDIHRAKPPGSMLTTECNSEPFIRWFDGYLTWHWQHDGQVPVFPAIYGGTVQMFGRAYREGSTRELALRMKAAQQLVFGEQLGWLDPAQLKSTRQEEFFRQLAQLRATFSRYFYAGQMARPPVLDGQVPSVKADWQWSGEWWVTTDGLLTGAWKLPAEKRLLLLFVNVSDQPITASVRRDALSWGLPDKTVRCAVLPDIDDRPSPAGQFGVPVQFAPGRAQAWELKW